MKYTEDELRPISALQHMIFCERQCALIHVERLWVENRLTVEGQIMHQRVNTIGSENKGQVRVEYSMKIKSFQLGLIGVADVVEFHFDENKSVVKNLKTWVPFPVEYKLGKPKKDNSDKIQLCAQAICLEEMYETEILFGAIFYGKTRRRLDVEFDNALRQETKAVAEKVHAMLIDGNTPKPKYLKKCDNCSFIELCMPKVFEKQRSVNDYLKNIIKEI